MLSFNECDTAGRRKSRALLSFRATLGAWASVRRAATRIEREIVEVGRRHLVTEGAAGLSLRAIARELGMVSSAVYRYVASRDDLLTLLIVDAYTDLADAVDQAGANVDAAPGRSGCSRWRGRPADGRWTSPRAGR